MEELQAKIDIQAGIIGRLLTENIEMQARLIMLEKSKEENADTV